MLKINKKKLKQYLATDKIIEFETDTNCLNYFNTYDFQDFQTIEEMKAFQGVYGFNIGQKRYHINYDESLDVYY